MTTKWARAIGVVVFVVFAVGGAVTGWVISSGNSMSRVSGVVIGFLGGIVALEIGTLPLRIIQGLQGINVRRQKSTKL